ncbi:hypothetical protein AcV5_002722 [Taiwanofungus camphoratus]|nr:hypothetical protein AcV5_002722 [Antrodia cinnamomea]
MSHILLPHGYNAVSLTRRPFSTKVTKTFSDAKSAQFLAAAASPSSIPPLHGLPEVIFTGRANAGKSTLLNAVVGRTQLFYTSKQAGRTQSLNFYRVGAEPGKLILVDSPGYGSRGRSEWGKLFNHYVEYRKELRRVYILFNAKHGLNQVDRAMLASLDEQCQSSAGIKFTLQAVITKADLLVTRETLSSVEKMQKDIFEAAPTCLPAILTVALKQPHIGIEELRRSIAEACGLG